MGSTDLAFAMVTGGNWFKVPQSIKIVFNGKPKEFVTGKDLILEIIRMIGVDGALYKTLEFTGDTIQYLTMDDRFALCNMAIEAGAKNGIVAYDDITKKFMDERAIANDGLRAEPKIHYSDEDATYCQVINIDVANLEPVIAYPFLPENGHPISKAVEDNIKVDQVFVGSCTNGRLSDLKVASEILKGKKVAKHTRMIVTPGTQMILREATKMGYIDILVDAGAVVSNPTCGACLGGYMGILGDNEVCISTTNRNFVGRMGSRTSKVYLSNSAVAAASAISGYITNPTSL
jgi:3-isopropylmalate/(R)-2-methylmalate dehydratase large subunit